MYLCGKAMHVSRREGKTFKQVLGTLPGGYRRNVVEVQQHTTLTSPAGFFFTGGTTNSLRSGQSRSNHGFGACLWRKAVARKSETQCPFF
jgi:hypothetical protein